MSRTDLHIKKVQQLVFLLAVLVSLTPCTVKETLFHSFGLAFERPLNKNKTVQNFNSPCLTEMLSRAQTEERAEAKADILPHIKRPSIPPLWATPKKIVFKKNTKKASGNSPPIYILYKRLKFDMA